MIYEKYRNDINWYLKLNWNNWYSKNINGWNKDIRRTDVLMSAMFKSSKKMEIKTSLLIETIGYPEFCMGTSFRGLLFYKMFRRIDIDPIYNYMLFVSYFGNIQPNGGTNHIRKFNGMAYYKKTTNNTQRKFN